MPGSRVRVPPLLLLLEHRVGHRARPVPLGRRRAFGCSVPRGRSCGRTVLSRWFGRTTDIARRSAVSAVDRSHHDRRGACTPRPPDTMQDFQGRRRSRQDMAGKRSGGATLLRVGTECHRDHRIGAISALSPLIPSMIVRRAPFDPSWRPNMDARRPGRFGTNGRPCPVDPHFTPPSLLRHGWAGVEGRAEFNVDQGTAVERGAIPIRQDRGDLPSVAEEGEGGRYWRR